MILNYEPQHAEIQFSVDDQEVLSAQIQRTMQQWIYSNRTRVMPRKMKELAQEEIGLLQQFLVTGEIDAVRERGKYLANEGFGTPTMVNLASTLRLGCWEIAAQAADVTRFVASLETYTAALLDGFLKAYEEDLCREQQRTYLSLTKSQSKL